MKAAKLPARVCFWLPDSHSVMRGEGLGELCRVGQVQGDAGHGDQLRSVAAVRWMSPSNKAARAAWPWSRAWSRCRVRMGRNWVPVRK